MRERGTLIHANEAFEFLETIQEPVTRTLVNMALMKFVVTTHADKQAPHGDLDLLYVARVLEGFFKEHDVIARTLRGEKVGAWFENEADAPVR